MIVIKCKMCGGDMEASADKTLGTCKYCGSTMTLPEISDEQRADSFNRGNQFRRCGKFDEALAAYERIIQEDDSDAEAHWCCALCRFGIEYVEDPQSHEWLPTCHRMSFDSFLEDVDYLAALEHSGHSVRQEYQREAERIAEIQKEILAVSRDTEPFDVFLCYKETDDDGNRTRDSVLAQEIYHQLTDQKFRVFFARITLEDKAGIRYEPYIFAALHSARVMVAIGTKPDYFNAAWVKNEWSRFLSLMKKDNTKLLIPCYRDMEPYDMPEALSALQAYDMTKIGFMQELIRGIQKVIGGTRHTPPPPAIALSGGVPLEKLIQNGETHLSLLNYSAAEQVYHKVTDGYPEDYRGWWGLIKSETEGLTDGSKDLSGLNVWFGYVRKLAGPEELEPLEKEYVDYLRVAALKMAEDDRDSVEEKMRKYGGSISGLRQEGEMLEAAQAEAVKRCRAVGAEDEQRVSWCQIHLVQAKAAFKRRRMLLFVCWALIGLGVLLFALGLIARNSFVAVLGLLFLATGMIVLLKTRGTYKERKEACGKEENALRAAINTRREHEKENHEQLSAYVPKFARVNNGIAEYQRKIELCKRYLGLGEKQISALWFAELCEKIGISQPVDPRAAEYRKAVFAEDKTAQEPMGDGDRDSQPCGALPEGNLKNPVSPGKAGKNAFS